MNSLNGQNNSYFKLINPDKTSINLKKVSDQNESLKDEVKRLKSEKLQLEDRLEQANLKHRNEMNKLNEIVKFIEDFNFKKSNYEDKLTKDKNDFYSQLHFISSKFKINYPISPLLKYKYPSVTASIVRNIAKALFNCPKFYTQVLHLMNKMNLPPPFINTDYEFSELLLPKNFNCKTVQLNSESSESELEDNNSELEDNNNSVKINLDDSNSQLIRQSKRRRIKNLINERIKKLKTTDKSTEPNTSNSSIETQSIVECFDNYVELKRIKMDAKLKLVNKAESSLNIEHNFKTFTNPIKSNSQSQPDLASSPVEVNCIYERQLSSDELLNYSAFKNYSLGEPSSRLYVKNLDKKITELQLRTIFKDLLNLTTDLELNAFNVNLFKKGKMNGQAFVSLSNEQLARQAIDRTNGLLINKKPIVVCFARSMKQKDELI